MVRIILIGAGIVAGVVSGYFVKRAMGQRSPVTVPSWPDLANLPIPRVRSRKRMRQHPDGEEADNGAIYRAPESV